MPIENAQEFRQAVDRSEPPPRDLSPELTALWWSRKGDWHKAHDIVGSIDNPLAAWIHAHLHVVEGDLGNAAYWYSRARRPMPDHGVETEWLRLVDAALAA